MRSTIAAFSIVTILLSSSVVLAAGQSSTPATPPSGQAGMSTKGTAGSMTAGVGAPGRFTSEASATRACGANNVVWANTGTKVYHLSGDKYFGNTKHGSYMCLGAAKASGFHAPGQAASKG